RHRLSSARGGVAQHAQPAGCRQVRRGSAAAPGRHDRTRAIHHARLLPPVERRLSGMRERERRAGDWLLGRCRRPQPRRTVVTPAIDEMRGVVEMLPNRATFRDNLAIYLNYAGDFQGAEKEARTIQEPDAYATLAIAFAQLGQGKVEEAIASYNRMAGIGNVG